MNLGRILTITTVALLALSVTPGAEADERPKIKTGVGPGSVIVNVQQKAFQPPKSGGSSSSAPSGGSIQTEAYGSQSPQVVSGGVGAAAPAVESVTDGIEGFDLFCTDGVSDLCQPTVLLGGTFDLAPDAPAVVPAAAPAAPGPAQPQLTLAMIQQAFAQVPVPSAQIAVQPPGGETLVNFPTIYSTETAPFVESLTLLGRQVDLQISPATYTWVHGDGTTQTTDSPGRTWQRGLDMDQYVSHEYEKTAQGVDVRVDVTWTADFRVDSGAWQPVNGTVSVTGPTESLAVREADPLLVGKN